MLLKHSFIANSPFANVAVIHNMKMDKFQYALSLKIVELADSRIRKEKHVEISGTIL